MKLLEVQPTFTINVPVQTDALMPRIRQVIHSSDLGGRVASAGQCVDLDVDADEQRFWSPHLNVHVNDVESGSELYCRFSPRPEVWTLFIFLYFLATFLICGAAIYGYVQWLMGGTPWSLVIIPVAVIIIVLLHVASLVGQSLSSDQMEGLRQRLEATMERALSSPTGPECMQKRETAAHQPAG